MAWEAHGFLGVVREGTTPVRSAARVGMGIAHGWVSCVNAGIPVGELVNE